MRQWIMSITAASLLSAVAMTLTPPGRVRQVTRLACALVCALAVAGPLARLDFDGLAASIARYEQQAQIITGQAEEEAKMMDRTYIEEQCQAYILAKAAEAELAVKGVSLSARWDEEDLVWYPWTVTVQAPYDQRLSELIESELGIPAQRQRWRDDD